LLRVAIPHAPRGGSAVRHLSAGSPDPVESSAANHELAHYHTAGECAARPRHNRSRAQDSRLTIAYLLIAPARRDAAERPLAQNSEASRRTSRDAMRPARCLKKEMSTVPLFYPKPLPNLPPS